MTIFQAFVHIVSVFIQERSCPQLLISRNISTIALNMLHPDAMPAPLRISRRKQVSSPISQSEASRCDIHFKLPSQPILVTRKPATSANVSCGAPSQKSEACRCSKSTIPWHSSPILAQHGATDGNRTPSLDFSSLFMKSPALRLHLEKCACLNPSQSCFTRSSPSFEPDQSTI